MADAAKNENLQLFDSMMLLSVLSTAADVRDGIERRRTGRDPTAQEEAAYVRAYLSEAADRLDEGFIRLLIHQVCAPQRDAVRHMDQLLLVQRLGRELHLVHQRLLSLYPYVSEGLVEEVRLLERQCDNFSEVSSDSSADDIPELVDRGLHVVSRLRQLRYEG